MSPAPASATESSSRDSAAAPRARRLLVGLTGGIGSGKSTVADRFAARGAAIVDTDAIAHELTGPGGAAIAAIRAEFGDRVIRADGALDRDAMRERAFEDPAARRKLEAILHPMIRAESQRRLEVAEGPYAMLVVPLLGESEDRAGGVDRVLGDHTGLPVRIVKEPLLAVARGTAIYLENLDLLKRLRAGGGE